MIFLIMSNYDYSRNYSQSHRRIAWRVFPARPQSLSGEGINYLFRAHAWAQNLKSWKFLLALVYISPGTRKW